MDTCWSGKDKSQLDIFRKVRDSGLGRGISLTVLWREACEWAIQLLSSISCSNAREVPGSLEARRDEICIWYWSTQCLDTVIVPLPQEIERCFSAIYWNRMFFNLSAESASCFGLKVFFSVLVRGSVWYQRCVLGPYIEEPSRLACFSDSIF